MVNKNDDESKDNKDRTTKFLLEWIESSEIRVLRELAEYAHEIPANLCICNFEGCGRKFDTDDLNEEVFYHKELGWICSEHLKYVRSL